jgi:hypothetical protein
MPGMAKPKKRPDPVIESDDSRSPSNPPATEPPATTPPEEQDPVTENRRAPEPIPEEGGRGEHSDDDPITRERVAEDLQE